jgi:hypothetical protein
VAEAFCTEKTDVSLPPGVGVCKDRDAQNQDTTTEPPSGAGVITTCANTLVFLSLALLVL